MTTSKNENGINEETVAAAYRRVLSGEKLDSINVREEVKDIIRDFSKYSQLSACQISEKTGISTRICATLRKMARINRRRKYQDAACDRYGITYAVMWLLKGKDAEYLKLHLVTPETIKKAKKCLKIMESGGNVPDLYKIGLSHSQSLKLIELYHQKHPLPGVPMSPTYQFIFSLFPTYFLPSAVDFLPNHI